MPDVVETTVSIPENFAAPRSWSTAIDDWTTYLRASNSSDLTILERRYQLSMVARTVGPDPWRVAPVELIRFLGRPGWAPETRKSYRSALRSFYGWAIDFEFIERDPTVKLPKVAIPPTEPRPAPDDVFARALAGATDRDRLILMLGAYAGLRRSEMAGLRWDQINGGAMRIKGKGGKVRTVPLHSDLAAELHAERQRRTDLYTFGTGWRFAGVLEVGSPYVFPGPPGRHIRPDSLGKAATKALGRTGWTAHTLRARFATRAYGADRDLFAVQRLLGHSRPETTARYADVPAGALEAAVRAAG